MKSPALWGDKDHLAKLFGSEAHVAATSRNFVFRYKLADPSLEVFRTYYGPVLKAFTALTMERRGTGARHLRPARQVQHGKRQHARSAE